MQLPPFILYKCHYVVHSENFLTGRVFVLQTWDFWKHTNTALKDTPLRCDPTQISLLCRFIFFLCFSSGFLRTQWGFSIQITQKFGGKYQIVQLRWGSGEKEVQLRCAGKTWAVVSTLSHLKPFSPCLISGFNLTASRTGFCVLLLDQPFPGCSGLGI